MKIQFTLLFCFLFCACTSKTANQTEIFKTGDNHPILSGADSNRSRPHKAIDSDADFERKIYFQIKEIKSGKIFSDVGNTDVFYRVLVIPEEENIMLIAEKISIGEEGGNFKLVKMSRLTDDNSVLPQFGLNSVDSLKFIDSVTIDGFFNGERKTINLDKLKPYHNSHK